MSETGWTYCLDAADFIVEIGGGWDEFALANDAPDLVKAEVLGSNLRDHVSDPSTWSLLELILTRVRVTSRPARLPFRCDSPAARRFMVFQAEPRAEGAVRITTRLRVEKPHRVPIRVLDRRSPRNASRIRMCSWCNFVDVGESWRDVPDAIRQLKLLHAPLLPAISYQVCPACEHMVKTELDRRLGREESGVAR